MTKHIIKDQAVVEDTFTLVDAESALPEGDIIVPFSRYQAEKDALANHAGKVGVSVNGNDYDIYEIGEELAQHELVALDFPAFVDGRCYSFAKLLRDRFGFKGEIRAIGNVLKDQLNYMHRCGINAFDIEDGKDIDVALKGINDFTAVYQP